MQGVESVDRPAEAADQQYPEIKLVESANLPDQSAEEVDQQHPELKQVGSTDQAEEQVEQRWRGILCTAASHFAVIGLVCMLRLFDFWTLLVCLLC